MQDARWSSRLVAPKPEARRLPTVEVPLLSDVGFVDRPAAPLTVQQHMCISSSWDRRQVSGVDTVFFRGLIWLQVRASGIEGMGATNGLIDGLFAARNFRVGEQIGDYAGESLGIIYTSFSSSLYSREAPSSSIRLSLSTLTLI